MCAHYEIIPTPEPGKPLIGRCIYCGRERNYTELQANIPDIGRNKTLLRKNVSMDRIIKTPQSKDKVKKRRYAKR